MEGIPGKIYLQLGEDVDPTDKDWKFDELGEITWASERIYPTDIEYQLVKKPKPKIPIRPPSDKEEFGSDWSGFSAPWM